MAGLLIVNPRAGSDEPSVEDLCRAASARAIGVHVLESGEDVVALARSTGATVLGVAGGDGSLGTVAAVAIERDLPFVCVPFGTRNHFARDVGLDPRDPLASLAAFAGVERRVDVGRIDGQLFLNNVSLGAYAHLVHRRERARRRREALAAARAIWIALRRRRLLSLGVDGETIRARIVLVSNNAYRLGLLSLGARDSIEEGVLYLYTSRQALPWRWQERPGVRLTLEGEGLLTAAIDGEPAKLEGPLELRIEPLALRLLLPAP